MIRQTYGKKLVTPLFGIVVAFIIAATLMPQLLSNGHTRVNWRLSRDWGIGVWIGREVDNVDTDESQSGEPAMQVYRVQRDQVGPISLVTRWRVPPRPGEVLR